ncbi:hypothetical protein [Variovorax boronicumulans]
MASITITLTDQGDTEVIVHTDAEPPQVGKGVSPAQAIAMELLGTAYKRGAEVVYDPQRLPSTAFYLDLLTPEGLGFACTAEVRDRARNLLGRPSVETPRRRGAAQ